MRSKTIGVFALLAFSLGTVPAQAATTWPGSATTRTADGTGVFGTNLSGLAFESPNVVWAVKNGPSTLYRLVPNGAAWRVDQTRPLRFGSGQGDPDAEGVVVTPDGLFVVSERDNDNGEVSAPTILRYGSGSSASAEWKLAGMPEVDPNAGPEGIAWIPDAFLTKNSFLDERTNKAYNPADYPGHGSGLFAVGLEATGTVYVYALQDNGSKLVAKFASGLRQVMDLEFENNRLWATCDDHCNGRAATLAISNGKFRATTTYERPSRLPNVNLEGFAIAPNCVNGKKTVLWADDDNTRGHALHTGTLNCG